MNLKLSQSVWLHIATVMYEYIKNCLKEDKLFIFLQVCFYNLKILD